MKHHLLDIFTANLYLCSRPKHWRKFRKLLDLEPEGTPNSVGFARMLVHGKTGEVTLVFYIDEREASLDDLVDTCSHEAAHAARFLLEHVGETERTHEVEPYLVGWLTRWLWSNLTEEVTE